VAGGTKIFEGLGPGTLIPQRGRFTLEDPALRSILGDREGFVLSRVDGHTSLQEIVLLVPFDEPTTMVILRKLWELGAIEVPGVARVILPPAYDGTSSANEFEKVPVSGLRRRPPEVEALAPPITMPIQEKGADEGMSDATKKRIDEVFAALDTRNAFEMLEIERTADDRTVKRAYFKLSKEFHPDRYFGRDIGEYRERLSKIFQALKASFEVLSDKRRREAYEQSMGLK
jgi:hypothetical protein